MTQLNLEELADCLHRMVTEAAREIPAASGRKLCVAAVAGAKRNFQTSTAPDGTPWAPLKFPRPNGGGKPLLDTGLLMASLSATFDGDTLTLRANGPGAAVHNFGAAIRPVKGKYLAIPVTREARKATGPRAFPRKLFFVPRKSGPGGSLAEAVEKGKQKGQLLVHYLLRDHVDVPAREFLGFSSETLLALGEIAEADLGGAILKPLTGPT